MKNLHPHQIGFNYFELLIRQPGKNIRLMSSIDFEKTLKHGFGYNWQKSCLKEEKSKKLGRFTKDLVLRILFGHFH